ncbi:GABA-specific high-affinity permease [Gnomoniopsis smithogilvyi]|uniref:GABA-specific high-affinity permease n=1 Tax=Gnomoniopsis smithogilvyi TaxID=1191159 RepID=A0A9W8Z4J5_9PEZI|nr:GABA-specific high-affinity permease [Gnomoniopsis smithogilvyi]
MSTSEKISNVDGVPAEQHHHHPELVTTGDGGVVLASEADAELLAKMGYKQELKRNFSTLEVFGIAFSIMGLLPSIASTLSFSLASGPAGMVWSWFLASGCIFVVGLAMADLGSAMPTSGGLYWWTHYFSSPSTRNYLSFLVGYSNSLGLIGGLCSINYGFALMFCAVIVISTDGTWTPSNGIVYVVFMVCTLSHGVLAMTLTKIMNKLQTFAVVMNIALILATIIALPVGRASQRNDGHFIFANVENLTTWPTGWAFMLAWLSPIWTIGAFDSCVHMSEEASNAAKAVPLGILSSIGMCWGLGFVIVIVLAACMNQDVDAVLGSSFGQPMAQIYYDALGKHGAMGFIAFLFIVQYLMGLSIVVAASRQMWAFSRDGALPFSPFFRPISKRFGYIPLRAVWGAVFAAIVLGLLCLIASAAASALFSLAVAGNNLAWGLPIFARAVWGREKFTPGTFYTGKRFSLPIAWAAIAFLVFGIILAMFPDGGPDPTPQTMNYTVVVNMAVWGGCTIYYFVDARKWFTGPKTTVEEIDEVVGQEVATENNAILGDAKVAEAEGSGPETEKQS